MYHQTTIMCKIKFIENRKVLQKCKTLLSARLLLMNVTCKYYRKFDLALEPFFQVLINYELLL